MRSKNSAAAEGETTTRSTSDRLLEVAARDFRRYGYTSMSMRELAEALGIQKASLYYHIKSKDELLLRICMTSLDRITASVEEACASVPEEDRLRAAIRAHCSVALRDQDMHAVMLGEMRALTPVNVGLVRKRRANYEGVIRDLIGADQRAGRLRTDIPAKLLTLALLNLLNWTIFWYHFEGPWTADELSSSLTEIFLRGSLNVSELTVGQVGGRS
jgi:TetR/AcrR family transcriptional regulator, cholesterol catabolism regulator